MVISSNSIIQTEMGAEFIMSGLYVTLKHNLTFRRLPSVEIRSFFVYAVYVLSEFLKGFFGTIKNGKDGHYPQYIRQYSLCNNAGFPKKCLLPYSMGSTRKVGGPRFLGTLPRNLVTIFSFPGWVPSCCFPFICRMVFTFILNQNNQTRIGLRR